MSNRKTVRIVALTFCVLMMLFSLSAFSACKTVVLANDLLAGYQPNEVQERTADSEFITAYNDFAVELFQKTYTEGENSMISPLSVMVALAMAANGADGETKTQMESTLCNGMSIETLNEYLHSYVNSLPSAEKEKLNVANSIWFRDTEALTVEPDFLQTTVDYYNAQIFKSAFDAETVADINNWVSLHTDDMIKEILDAIPDDAMMYLLNAVVFDAKWENEYEKESINENGVFNSADGDEITCSMMTSTESSYIENEDCTGFIKNYYNGDYGFMALLPDEDVDINDFVNDLSGEKIAALYAGKKICKVIATTPKFEADYFVNMNDALQAMGIVKAFSMDAEFLKMANYANESLCIGNVLHKTYISLDESGTKAAAVTIIGWYTTSVAPDIMPKRVTLDRPFVYAIVDNATGLPIFLGVLTSV